MTFVVCTISRQQAEHGFDTIASLQTAGGAAVGIGWDSEIVLTVGCKAHDVVPVKITHLRQMVTVKVGIVGENRTDSVLIEPDTQISDGLGAGAEDGLHRRFDKQGAFLHTADLTLNGQNMIFSCDKLKSVRICYNGANTHDLICPVGFCVNDSEFAHVFLS